MPRIIFTSRYLKNASKGHMKNYVQYLGTRPGAERLSAVSDYKGATIRQQEWIEKELLHYPEAKQSLEYADYVNNRTLSNASELISKISEAALESGYDTENYIGYLANRPRAEKLSQGHALWNGSDGAIDLNKVKEEAANHKGYIWTHVVSLRREDAERLGFNNAEAWRELVRSRIPLIAESMKIPLKNIVWYGAFHNEGHHPHIHLMVYSKIPREGYLTEKGIETMRRAFASDIFHDELYQTYEQKDQARREIKEFFDMELKKAAEMKNKNNPKAAALLLKLSGSLKNSKYHVYGRLSKGNKVLVDEIVSELSKDEKIEKLYQSWQGLQDSIVSTYKKTGAPKKTISEEMEFRNLKNKVIKAALELGKEAPHSKMLFQESEVQEEKELELSEPEISDFEIFEPEKPEGASGHTKQWLFKKYWTADFKRAKKLLRTNEVTDQDLEIAYELLLKESGKGNPFAQYSLADLIAKGKGTEKEEELAEEYYKKAFQSFIAIEQEMATDLTEFYLGAMNRLGHGTRTNLEQATKWYLISAKKGNPFSQYNIGKMFFHGDGVLQSYTEAAKWYRKAAAQGNTFAGYGIGKMYYEGLGISQSYEEAVDLFKMAGNEIPFAAYRVGEMYEQGLGTEGNQHQADFWYSKALEGFHKIIRSEKDTDGSVSYKAGKMYLEGKGTEQKIEKGILYLKAAAEQSNSFALFFLLKSSIKKEYGIIATKEDLNTWIDRLVSKAEKGQESGFAQYALGYYYLFDPENRDIDKAIEWLKKAEVQGNKMALALLETANAWRMNQAESAFLRLAKNLSRMMENNYYRQSGIPIRTESKLMRKIMEKKIAQGQKIEY